MMEHPSPPFLAGFFITLCVPVWWMPICSLSSCPYLHRTAGDTERRYHLRYYKTSTCVYETDSRGYCIKNGPHCAFAHGPNDLRPPVYDVRELQGVGRVEDDEGRLVSPLAGSLEKDRGVLVEDPRWQGKRQYTDLRTSWRISSSNSSLGIYWFQAGLFCFYWAGLKVPRLVIELGLQWNPSIGDPMKWLL